MTGRSPSSARDDVAQHSPLPVGTRVRDYVVDRVLGNDGFGIARVAHGRSGALSLDRKCGRCLSSASPRSEVG